MHGLPGIIGGVLGAVSASLADSAFQDENALKETFPAIADGRTTSEQGWVQLAALGISLGISIGGGIISGFIASRFQGPDELFDDQEHFAHCDYTEVIGEEVGKKDPKEMMPIPPDSARGPTNTVQ